MSATRALVLAAAFSTAVTAFAQAGESPGVPTGPEQGCVGGTPPSGEGDSAFVRADVRTIAEQVTCYCGCPHLQVSKCFCGTADAIRGDFAQRLDAGQTSAQVIAAYVAEHGPSILAVPPRRGFHWIIWIGPPVLLLAGAVLVWLNGRRWTRGAPPRDLAPAIDPELEARYRAAVRQSLEER